MLRSYEPATGALLWEGPFADVASDIATVERAWQAWAGLPLVSRIETVRRFANNVRGHEEKFADLIARETGRPLWDTKAEVHALIMQTDLAVGAITERAGQRRLEGAMGARQALRHRPHGIIAVLGSHVQPARIPGEQIIAALLAGNGVLFKPSEKTPAVGLGLVDLLHGAGISPALLRCVMGGPETGEALIRDSRVDGALFTGTTANGIAISKALAGHPEKLVSLNMGGNNPVIVWDTADISSAAALVVQSAFAAGGQNCLAARRLVVAEGLADVLLPEVKQLSERLAINHPHAPETPFMGPLIDMEGADALTDSFLYLMSNGGKPILHMKRPFPGLPFVSPGIVDVTDMTKRPDVEYLGPLLQVVRVRSFEEAITAANETRFGLSAALIGGAPEQYDMFWANSRSGIVNWNRPTTTTPLSGPIGGIGLSGNHRPGGTYSADICAYPVVSSAIDQPRAMIGVGIRSHAVSQPATPVLPVPEAAPPPSEGSEADAA